MKIEFLLKAKMSEFYFSVIKDDFAKFDDPDGCFTINMIPDDNAMKEVDLRCLSDIEVSEELYGFVENFINGKYIPIEKSQISIPYIAHGTEWIDAIGNMKKGFPCPLDFFPVELQNICIAKRLQLNNILTRFLALLRWQQNIKNSHQSLANPPSLHWRVARSGVYHHVPSPRHSPIKAKMARGIVWSDPNVLALNNMWSNKEIQEPLGHELLREAVTVSESSPRSALLILCSALEVAVKQHISFMVPDSTLLIMEAPSPPIVKILNTYLPDLHSKDVVAFDWKKLKSAYKSYKVFEEMIKLRNKLAHKGEFGNVGVLPQYIEEVRNFLYILDVLEGHEWAKSRVDNNIKRLLGWPVDEIDKQNDGVILISPGF